MFEPNMDEYLDEEIENIKQAFEVICRSWDNTVRLVDMSLTILADIQSAQLSQQATVPKTTQEQARFIGSHNPAQVKRNVLASFTDVLLLPVTIVPRTTVAVGRAFGAALTTGGTAAVQGISMLNPQRWGASGMQWGSAQPDNARNGYVDFAKGTDATLFDVGVDEDDEGDEKSHDKSDNEKHEDSFDEKRDLRGMGYILCVIWC